MNAAQQLETFENIPESGLNNITSATIKEVSDADIFSTADIADVSTGFTDTPQQEKKGTVNANKNAQTTPTKLGGLVGGELGVRLLDAAVPALLVTVIHFIGYKMDKSKLKLNADDRKVIAPLMQDALNAIEIDFNNPFINLAFGLSVVYGSKLIEEIPNMERATKKAPAKIIEMPPKINTKESAAPPVVEMKDVQYDYDYDFSSVAQIKPSIAKIAPELQFKLEFDELLNEVRQQTGRKSRRGAISYLYQYDRNTLKQLLDKFGFSEPPNDKDFNHVKNQAKNIDFSLS